MNERDASGPPPAGRTGLQTKGNKICSAQGSASPMPENHHCDHAIYSAAK
jgi:hypothetical protein